MSANSTKGDGGGAPAGDVIATDEARAFYDDMWRKYAHLDAVSPAAIHRRRQVRRLARRYCPGARVILDVGCGQGELLRELAPHFPESRIMGADISEHSIQDSRKLNPGFELFTIDLTAPDFEEKHKDVLGTCELVVCSEVLEHIPNAAFAASRLRLLATPGGTVIVTVPGGRMSRFDVAIGHQKHYEAASLRALLTGVGLNVLAVRAWGFPFHSIYREAVRVVSRVTTPKEPPKPGEADDGNALSKILGGGVHDLRKIDETTFLSQPVSLG
jgi:2-polyprenyl-3-methyl-5-hydroxy-6-metoxy-1,4-benzoquinol methylase